MLESVIVLLALPADMPAPALVEFTVPAPLRDFGNTFLELREAEVPDAPAIPVWRSQVGPWAKPWCETPLCALVPPPKSATRPVRYVLDTEAGSDRAFALEEVDDAPVRQVPRPAEVRHARASGDTGELADYAPGVLVGPGVHAWYAPPCVDSGMGSEVSPLRTAGVLTSRLPLPYNRHNGPPSP
jgi:hypothetical protein